MIERYNIHNSIERPFVIAIVITFLVMMFAAFFASAYSLSELYENNSKKVHETLSHILIPSLTISDSLEIERLLELETNFPEEIYAVIDNSGTVFLSDYTYRYFINQTKLANNKLVNCSNLNNTYHSIHKNNYWVSCSVLLNDNKIGDKQKLGILISFQRQHILFPESIIVSFLSMAILVVLLLVIWFRQILQKKLLKPLASLNTIISKSYDSILDSKITNAPVEIQEINLAFRQLLSDLKNEYNLRVEFEKAALVSNLAAKVAHNIRSPISILENLVNTYDKYDYLEHKSALLKQVANIRSIANIMLEDSKRIESNIDDDKGLKTLYTILQDVIANKKLEWQLEQSIVRLTYAIKPIIWLTPEQAKVKVILSNMLNNAYEASTKDNYLIEVMVSSQQNNVIITIKDRGCGIPDNEITNVLNGKSLKVGGNGIGLSSAVEFIQSIKGCLKLSSKVGFGTIIDMWFPVAAISPIFAHKIVINTNNIVILDDNIDIISFWQEKLYLTGLNIRYFVSAAMLSGWLLENHHLFADTTFFLDYDIFKELKTGLDIIMEFMLPNTYLVTNYAEDFWLQEKVKNIEIKLIPKALLTTILDIYFE